MKKAYLRDMFNKEESETREPSEPCTWHVLDIDETCIGMISS